MDFRRVLCLLGTLACSPQAAAPAAVPAESATAAPLGARSPGHDEEVATNSALGADGETGSEHTTGALPPLTLEDKRRHLPEVVVENMGLHIGGESNSVEAKRPFVEGLEKQFESFRWCYRFVDLPGEGGVFGVDLLVPRDGRGAQVREVRTRMAGEEFKGCMVAAFSEAVFDAPRRPVVFSYSLRFSLSEPQ